nr:MAG TPA: hypothetical protein [Caudoviricetes sp.]
MKRWLLITTLKLACKMGYAQGTVKAYKLRLKLWWKERRQP